MNNELVKGFKEFSGQEAEKREAVRKVLVSLFEKYGFSPAETPVIESESFVKGDNERDEAVSDIYRLEDKGKRKLALRYEFTFQLKRLMKNKKLPFRRYQIGPVFRDEPVSGNRFRQFIQCDVDVVGSVLKDEAEILSLVQNILKNLGIEGTIYVNNRKLLNEILDKEGIGSKKEVITEIDKLDKLSEREVANNLKKYKAENLIDIFKKGERYFERYETYSEILELKKYCANFGVEVKFLPTLARGLSYYNGTIFEIKSKKFKETITAGGSYMFNGIQCSGISFGLDRLSMLLGIEADLDKFLVVSLKQDKKAISLAQKLRNEGKKVVLYYGKPSKALDYANSYSINNVVFVGADEIKKKKFMVKEMKSGRQKTLILEKRSKKNVVLKKK